MPLTSANQGFVRFRQSQVQAIVFEAPSRQSWAAMRGNGTVQIVGLVFRPEKPGIAVAAGSPGASRCHASTLRSCLVTAWEPG
jgi:polar amino acid transport system substrate-binding protein